MISNNLNNNAAEGNHGNQVAGGSTEGDDACQSQAGLSRDEAMIASVVAGLITKYKEQASTAQMETENSGAGGGQLNVQSVVFDFKC